MGLVSELRRRNVFRMAVLFVVAAWVIMQVAEVVVTLAALPDWSGQIILILLAVGFPISLIFSWFYEITPEGVSLERDVDPSESITRVTGRRLDILVISLLCAAVILFAYDKWWISGPPITSIAVLPLDNLSNDPEQEYFAVGMTDVLTDTLAQVNGLRVISRISANHYKTRDRTLPEIAGELDVDAIVDGSVQSTGDKIRLTLQLIDGRTDRHLWSSSYYRDLGDTLTLQGEIARAIANEIQITLDPKIESRFKRDRSVASDAVRLWVLGNHHLKYHPDADSMDKALQAFTEATELAEDFAPGYAGIANTYLYLASWSAFAEQERFLPLARSAAEQALELDPYLADAHFALAEVHRFDWKWEAADREFKYGKQLNPNDSYGLLQYVNFLIAMGRFEEAIEIGERVVAIDPFWPAGHAELGHAFYVAGRDDDALREFERSLQFSPGSTGVHDLMAYVHIRAGRYDKALQHLKKIGDRLEHLPSVKLGRVGRAYGLIGHHDEARHILSILQERRATGYVPAIALAYVYIGLEEYDEAFAWLEAAYGERSASLSFIGQYWSYDILRSDPRFQDILTRMDFPSSNGD